MVFGPPHRSRLRDGYRHPCAQCIGREVVQAGWDGAYGNRIIVRHDNGVKTMYAHLSSTSVNVGDKVTRGQRIGAVGTTGNSSGPHLHFEVIRGDPARSQGIPLALVLPRQRSGEFSHVQRPKCSGRSSCGIGSPPTEAARS